MTKRVLPTPEKFASYPNNGLVLEYYEGHFECVYVLLHPFIKPVSIDPELFYPDTWPSKMEIIEGCEAVSWNEVRNLTSLHTVSDIDVGLRTIIGGLTKEESNEKYAEILIDFEKSQGIILPTEGDLPPLLENKVYSAIMNLGYEWCWVGDQFGTERKLNWIEDLEEKEEIPPHGCVFTHDHRISITTHWDSHCSFLCSSKVLIKKILSVHHFEGFYCTNKTEVYWGLHEI